MEIVDYRKLNDVTTGDKYPLPDINELLDQLGRCQYFTTLDLASGFHQIQVNEKDVPKTAFTVENGHYEFLRMPFGLKNAPSTFQRVMDNIMRGLNNEICLVYMDDIIVYSSTLEEHIQRLSTVFKRLRKSNLKLQPDKCEFLKREVAYLGHVITKDGVKPNPDKISAVTNFPIPKSIKDIQSFLGLSGYYRRFISNYSKITKPLTALLKKDIPFNFDQNCLNSFNLLKQSLTKAPILQYPNFEEPFILTCDASNFAIGSVLSQGPLNKDLPIAYASRTLNQAEVRYSTIEKELLAIVWSVRHFRPYLYGRRFLLVTDHKPLTWLFSIKDPGSRLARWRLKLEEYDYEIVYKPGKINKNADALSRIKINALSAEKENLIREEFKKFEKIREESEINNNVVEAKICDLFNMPKHFSLAHSVSQDLRMSQGIANEFRKKFKRIDELLLQNKKVGEIAYLKDNDRYIFYLITKEHFYDKPSYFNVFLTLWNLKELLETLKVNKLAIPEIGCGLDKLKWPIINDMLEHIFCNTNIDIYVCLPEETGEYENFQDENSNDQIIDISDESQSENAANNEIEIEDSRSQTSENNLMDTTISADETFDEELKLFLNNLKTNSLIDFSKVNFINGNLLNKRHKNIMIVYSPFEEESKELIKIKDDIPIFENDEEFQIKSSVSIPNRKYFIYKFDGLLKESNRENISLLFKLFRCNASHIKDNFEYYILQMHKDLYLPEILSFIFASNDVKINIVNQTTLPPTEERNKIIQEFHDDKNNLHRGISETLRRIREHYEWPNMTNEVADYIKACALCNQCKVNRKNRDSPFVITETPNKPFERINIDILEIPSKNYILTINDDFSKYVQAYTLENKTAKEIVQKLLSYFQHYGVPKRIHCDQGPEFNNIILKDLAKLYNFKLTYSSVAHPQSNGSLERFHSTLLESIRILKSENEKIKVCEVLPYALITYNKSKNASTGFTPYELLFGHTACHAADELFNQKELISKYVKDLNERISYMYSKAAENIEKMKQKAKSRFDKHVHKQVKYKENQLIWLRNSQIKDKLSNKYSGPHKILKILPNNSCIIQLKNSNVESRVNYDRLKPYYETDLVEVESDVD